MKRKLNKTLSLIMAMIMVLGTLPVVSLAASVASSGTCGDNLTWTLDSEGTLTISGSGEMWDYYNDSPWRYCRDSIETVQINNGVTSIGYSAFKDCYILTSITIPDSVTSISNYAFDGCSSLTSITIPDGVTSIDTGAFWGCSSLTSITIPDSVTSIGSGVFDNTPYYDDSSNWENGVLYIGNHLIEADCDSLSNSYKIKDGTKCIAGSAFRYCSSLTSITIPDSVTSIGDGAFGYCSSLTSIIIPNSVTSIGDSAFYGTAYYDDTSNWENGVLYIGNHLIKVDSDFLSSSYTIKDGTKCIADSAFRYCRSLTSMTIPNSVTSIGDSAFNYCSSLTDVTIGNGVTSIGNSAFYGCSSLTSITIPDSVTSIGNSAFYGCSSLTSITIPDSVTSIGNSAFIACSSLTSITIPDSVTSIGGSAFWNCSSLTSITIPDSVTSIGGYAFEYCSSLTDVTIGNGVTSIGDSAFEDCSNLTSITIPDSVTSIGDYAFRGCSSLTDVTIGNGVTSIGEYAFYDCSSLTSITIPDSVTSIGDRAFYGCSSLTSVTLGNNVTSIGHEAFYNCSSLTSITIPDSVTSIGDYAFRGCSSLTDVTIGNGVTSIGEYAFYDCSSLTSITIPDSVTSIGIWAFYDTAYYNDTSNWENGGVLYIGNHLIKAGFDGPSVSYTIKDGTKCIADYALRNCSNLTSITIPNGVTNIGDYAFYGCSSLKSVTIPNSVTSIGDYAFESCSSLTSITIPDSVSIGDYAFYDTAYYNNLLNWENDVLYIGNHLIKVASVFLFCSYTIKDGTKYIADYMFCDCYNLTSITIPDSVTSIGEYAFGYMIDDGIGGAVKVPNFTIYGYTGSAAETYANENGFKFIALDKEQHTHSYTSKVTKAATCTETGVMTYTCSCGESYTETIAKKAHKLVTIPAVATTCSKAGSTAGTKCSVCGTVTVAPKAIAKKAHTYKKTTTKATTSKNGSVVEKCTVCGNVKSNVAIAKVSTVKLSKTSFTYNGKTQKPSVTVKDSKGKTLKNGTDYTVKYSKGCKNVGQYTVTITFKGNYSGTKTLTFKIVPKGTSISKLTAGKKQFTVKWNKDSQGSGYEIQYSTSSKMKNAKTVKIGKSGTTSTTIKKLKSGKKYYVRVRTYKTVKINGKSVKLYSSWSKVKNIKTK